MMKRNFFAITFLISFAVFGTAPLAQSQDVDGAVRASAMTGYPVGPSALRAQVDLRTPTLRPFSTDGCSISPDQVPFGSDLTKCCVQHDIHYWMGGSRDQKAQADRELKLCIAKTGNPRIGQIYKAFVRKFGSRSSSRTFRWGFGWNYQRPYAILSEKEQRQVAHLYGASPEKLLASLATRDHNLVLLTDTFDSVFSRVSAEENMIYATLNSMLINDDVIEHAAWGYFNLDKREFLIKTKKCDTAYRFTLGTKSAAMTVLGLDGGC